MAINAKELFLGNAGDVKGRNLQYLVREAPTETEAIAEIIATAPALRDGLVLKNASAKEIGFQMYKGAAIYAEATEVPRPDVSSSTYTFNLQVKSEVVFFSENRLQKIPANAPEVVGGRIGIEVDQTEGRWSGIEIPSGPITDEISFEYPNAVIPQSYRDTVRSYAGAVNSDTFLNQPPGSMRLLSVNASVTSDDRQTIAFGFGNRENRTSVVVGSHTIASLDGWDFFWTYDKQTIVADAGTSMDIVFSEPQFVYVERLLARKTFATLGIDL